MVSSKTSGDLKGALAFISMTCNWSSFPKVKRGSSTKFTALPQKSFMTLSTMGKACSSSLTRENSCSGPKTSSGLYVAAPLFYLAFIRNAFIVSVNFKHDCGFLNIRLPRFQRITLLTRENQSDFMEKQS